MADPILDPTPVKEDITLSLPTQTLVPEIVPIDDELAKKEIERITSQRQRDFEKLLRDSEVTDWDAFVTRQKTAGVDVPFATVDVLFERIRELEKKTEREVSFQDWDDIGTATLNKNIIKEVGELNKLNRLYRTFKSDQVKQHKERFERLPDFAKRIEVEHGGVYGENMPLRSFSDSLVNSFTFGLVAGDHPIYGKMHRELNPKADFAGATIGTVASFMLLNAAGGVVQVPGRIANVIRGTKAGAKILEVGGYIPYQLGRFTRMGAGLRSLGLGMAAETSAVEGAQLAAGNAIFMGLTHGLGNTVREYSERYRVQDGLTKGDWEKLVPTAVKNFWLGYGLSVINAPKSWGIRLMGDALWSAADQSVQVMTGQREGFSKADFFQDWLLYHVLGEVQQRVFSTVLPNQFEERMKVPTVRKAFEKFNFDKEARKVPATDSEKLAQAEIINMMEQHPDRGGRRFTEQEFEAAFQMRLEKMRGTVEARGSVQTPVDETFRLDEAVAPENFQDQLLYARLGSFFKWDQATRTEARRQNVALNEKSLLRFVKDQVDKKKPVEAVEPLKLETVTFDRVRDNWGDMQEFYRNQLAAGRLSKKEKQFADIISRINLDEFLIDKRTALQISDKIEREAALKKMDLSDSEKNLVEEYRKNILENRQLHNELVKIVRGELGPSMQTLRVRGDFIEELQDVVQSTLMAAVAKPASDKFWVSHLRRKTSPINVLRSLAKLETMGIRMAAAQKFVEETERMIKSGQEVGEQRLKDTERLKKSLRETPRTETEARARQLLTEETKLDVDPIKAGEEPVTPLVDKVATQMFKENPDLIVRNTDGEPMYSLSKSFVVDEITGPTRFMEGVDNARIIEASQQKPSTMFQTILRHLARQGMNNRAILQHLQNAGITEFSQSQIKNILSNIQKTLRKMDDIISTTNPRPEATYTPRQVRQILNKSKGDALKFNPVTGIRTDIESPSYRRNVIDNGAAVLSVDVRYNQVRKWAGKNPADMALQKMGKIIRQYVQKTNRHFVYGKEPAGLKLRNPLVNDGTIFVLSQEGIAPGQFRQIVADLNNYLRDNYKGNLYNNLRRWRIAIQLPDGGYRSFTDMKNIRISFTKDPTSLIKKADWAANIIAEHQEFFRATRMDNFLYDKTNPFLVEEVNNILGAQLRVDREAAALRLLDEIDEAFIPEVAPPIIDGEIAAQKVKMAGGTEREAEAERNRVINLTEPEVIEEPLRHHIARQEEESLGTFISKELQRNEQFNQFRNLADQFIRSDTHARNDFAELNADMQIRGDVYDNKPSTFIERTKGRMREMGQWFREKMISSMDRGFEKGDAVILQAMGERDTLTTVNAPQMISKNFYKFVTPMFKAKNKKELATQLNYFNRIFEYVIEKEQKVLWRDDVNYRPKAGVLEELTKPIKWSNGEEPGFVKDMFRSPDYIDNSNIIALRRAARDDLVYSKLIVQKLNIDPAEFVRAMGKLDYAIFKPLEKMYEMIGDAGGNYQNQTLHERVLQGYEDAIKKTLLRLNPAFAAEFKITDSATVSRLKEIIAQIPEERTEKDILARYLMFSERADPDKMSFVHHAVLGSIKNQTGFSSEYNDILKNIEGVRKPKETLDLRGRVPGDRSMDVNLHDLTNRKFLSFEDLFDAGYHWEVDGFKNLLGLSRYLYTSAYNKHLADNFHTSFTKRMIGNYDRIFGKIEAEYRRIDADPLMPDAERKARLEGLIAQKRSLHAEWFEFMSDQSGYFYLPSQQSINKLRKTMKDIRERIETLQEARDYDRITDLKFRADNLELQAERWDKLQEIFYGVRLVQEERDFLTRWDQSPDKNVKIAQEEKKLRAKQLEEERWAMASEMKMKLTANEEYVYMNRRDFDDDKIPAKLSFLEGLPNPWKDRKTIKGEIKRMGIHPSNFKGWEGLYFHSSMMKSFKQFLFRQDMSKKVSHYDVWNDMIRLYDNTNFVFKTIVLVKPTVLWANSSMQSMLATDFFKINVKSRLNGIDAYMNRFNPDHPQYALYQRARNQNLFHHRIGMSSIVSDYTRAFFDVLGTDDKAGFIKHFAEIFKGNEPGLADAQAQTKVKRLAKYVGGSAVKGFKSWQEIAWAGDEILRLGVFDMMSKRFQQANDPATADRLAGKWTNLFMVDYSRIPHGTRVNLNRFFVYPTYRYGSGRMWVEIAKMFGKGVARTAGFNPKNEFVVSNKRFQQALFEMSPMLRALGLKVGIKAMIFLGMGFHGDDVWDLLFNYRVKDIEGDGINATMRFLALGTPLFEVDKYARRPWKLTLRYNIAGLPNFMYMLATNSSPITQKPLWTVPWREDPRKAMSQTTMQILRHYFPFGQDFWNFRQAELDFMEKMLNFSGMGYFYDVDNPRKIMEDYNLAVSRALTVAEHQRAYQAFKKNMNATYFRLFDEKYKDIYVILNEQVDEQLRRRVK